MTPSDAALVAQVEKTVGNKLPDSKVTKLRGDASSRIYYRVQGDRNSWVVMYMDPASLAQSDEVSHGGTPTELPFTNVHRYLEKLRVRVPKIYSFEPELGMMVLEDLSDVTFEQALLSTGKKESLYKEAVELLAYLRAAAEANQDRKCIAFSRSFDEQLYDWEFHHFREWGMEAWSGKIPTAEERSFLDGTFKKLSLQLAAGPKGFTHRDYQSRNLMMKTGEMVVIDFQDALLGPRQYDLVALLRDSYVELERHFVEEMLDVYRAAFERETGEKIPKVPFVQFFDLLTVQRKLKDAGRFEFIHRKKNNPSFLPHIPLSLAYVRDAFARQPHLSELQKVCAKYVPALS